MSLRRRVGTAILIQPIGVVASFLTLLLIARTLGPVAQGEYAQVKAWVDLIVAIGCFGFPQGFVYIINKFGASRERLFKTSIYYVIAIFPLSLFAGIIFNNALPKLQESLQFESTIVISIAISAIVLHELWRGIYLTYEDGMGFSIWTILQAVGLFLSILLIISLKLRRFHFAYLGCAVFCLVIDWALIRHKLVPNSNCKYLPIPWLDLFNNGFHVFFQNVMAGLQPAITFWFIRSYALDGRSVGWFSLALYVYQSFALPIGMVSPIFFNKWLQGLSSESLKSILNLAIKVSLLIFVISLLLLAPMKIVVIKVFGIDYEKAIIICKILLMASAPLILSRTLSLAVHSVGRPQINSYLYMSKLVMIVLIIIVFKNHGILAVAAVAWAVAEYASAIFTALYIWRLSNSSMEVYK